MPRLFLPGSEIHGRIVSLKDEKARYLSTVLRCKTGDPLIVKDENGNTYTARIRDVTKKEVTIEIIEKQQIVTESPLHITLLQGILKGEKMDFVIQKATELGVKEVRPVVTERSEVRETRKLPRWRKIAEEAARQSGRDIVPVVHEPAEFGSLFISPSSAPNAGIIFWEQGGIKLSDAVEQFRNAEVISLFTGPEGGFSVAEIGTASEGGFVVATLGKRILRAETAAITAVSVVQYSIGDLGVL